MQAGMSVAVCTCQIFSQIILQLAARIQTWRPPPHAHTHTHTLGHNFLPAQLQYMQEQFFLCSVPLFSLLGTPAVSFEMISGNKAIFHQKF